MNPRPDIDRRLGRLRLAGIAPPDEACLDLSPLRVDTLAEDRLWRDFLRASGSRPPRESLRGKCLALDLDDTLLPSDYTAVEPWNEEIAEQAVPAVLPETLATDWPRTCAAWLLGRRPARRPSLRRHPFLTTPRIRVCLRPGLLGALRALSNNGVDIVLVSATGRLRMDYLLRRLPDLAQLLARGADGRPATVAAEDMVAALDEWPCVDHNDETARLSAPVHTRLGASLAAKTPWLTRAACGYAYDLLVDDSEAVANGFAGTPCEPRLLGCEPGLAWSGYGLTLGLALLESLSAEHAVSTARLPAVAAHDAFWRAQTQGGAVTTCFEDPWYFHLLHTRPELFDRNE